MHWPESCLSVAGQVMDRLVDVAGMGFAVSVMWRQLPSCELNPAGPAWSFKWSVSCSFWQGQGETCGESDMDGVLGGAPRCPGYDVTTVAVLAHLFMPCLFGLQQPYIAE